MPREDYNTMTDEQVHGPDLSSKCKWKNLFCWWPCFMIRRSRRRSRTSNPWFAIPSYKRGDLWVLRWLQGCSRYSYLWTRWWWKEEWTWISYLWVGGGCLESCWGERQAIHRLQICQPSANQLRKIQELQQGLCWKRKRDLWRWWWWRRWKSLLQLPARRTHVKRLPRA